MNSEMKDEVVQLYLDDIIPNRFQPREVFDEKALKELAVSIKEHGVIQPIIVRNVNGKYEIIAGERRYKASALAGMTRIPAIIRDLDDKESSKVALLENLQRKNLNPIEEARTYQKILEIDQMTQEELAKTMGKSQSSVANKLRLLSLPDEVQDALLKEQVSERHARALISVPDLKKQSELLKKVINNKMTVRALEEEISSLYPKETNEEPEGDQYISIPSVNSIIDTTPLTPTTNITEDTFGKVSFVPPDGEKMENINKYVNYGEIDKDNLSHQNNINNRTNYYTSTTVAPIDIKSMQDKANDIMPKNNEPVAALDSLLNIRQNGPMNKEINQVQERIGIPPLDINKNPEQTSEEYFRTNTFKNFELPKEDIGISSAAISQDSILSIPTVKTVDSDNAIAKLKNFIEELSTQGVKITMDEMDFGKSYQVIIKIDK